MGVLLLAKVLQEQQEVAPSDAALKGEEEHEECRALRELEQCLE